MKKINRVNLKVVLLVEIALMLLISVALLFWGLNRDILKGMFVAGSVVIIIPTVFYDILNNRRKKDVSYYLGFILFFLSYGCYFRDLISIKIFIIMVVISFVIVAHAYSLTKRCNRDREIGDSTDRRML